MATFSYNGTAFAGLYRSRISSRPILDEAQRTTVYVEHSLEVDGYVVLDLDDNWTSLRRELTVCGGELVYKDKGFGDLIVNSTLGLARDVKWGPIPEILEFYPLGGDCNAARIRWRCTVRIPECDDAKYRDALLAYNYDATYTIDQDGYTTLRVAGYIEVPMTRDTVRTRTLPDSVDRYRVLLNSPAPLGFQRKTRTFRISQDKRRLDFSYTEEEIYSPLPDRVTSIQARQSVRNSDIGFKQWVMSLDATITMSRGEQKELALVAFLNLVAHRTDNVLRVASGRGQRATMIPIDFSVEDDIYGRSSRFTFSTRIVNPRDITALLEGTRMWWQADDWGKWRTSLQSSRASDVRGWANLELKKEDDAIVDLCLPTDQLIPRDSKPPKAGNPKPPDDTGKKLKLEDSVRPENSWVEYRNTLEYNETPGVIRHKLLPKNPPTGSGGGAQPPGAGNPGGTGIPPGKFVVGPPIGGGAAPNAAGGADEMRTSVGGPAASSQGGAPADVHQVRSSATREVVMVGYGIRLGWRVPVPRLVSVGGQTPVEVERVVKEEKVGGTLSCPLFGTQWIIRYSLPSAPSSLPHLANPVYDHDGGNGAQQTLSP